MSLIYRRVDKVLSGQAGGEVREGDRLLVETAGVPREGELVLARSDGGIESVRRWDGEGECIGLVVGVRRRL